MYCKFLLITECYIQVQGTFYRAFFVTYLGLVLELKCLFSHCFVWKDVLSLTTTYFEYICGEKRGHTVQVWFQIMT